VNTVFKATGDTSKLEKIHPGYLSNKTWKWWKSLSTDKLFQWRMKNEQCNGNVVCAVYKGDPGIGNASGSPHLKFCCDRQTGGRTDRQHTISITIRHFAMRALPGKNSGTNKRRKRKSMNFQSGKQSIMQSVKTDRRMPATYGWRQ